MANVMYPKAKEGFIGGDIALDSDNIKAVLVDTASYTYSATHEFLSEIPSGERVATSSNLTSKTITDGVFDSDDILYTAVTGDTSEALVLYQDSGSEATSRLIVYIDTATGLPVTPDGTNINVSIDNAGWFEF
jgi:hypothetical protein